MTKQINEKLRQELEAFISIAIKNAVESIEDFISHPNPKPKEFKEKHDACRVSIAHLQLLLKLAQMVSIEEAEKTEILEIQKMIGNAQKEIGIICDSM